MVTLFSIPKAFRGEFAVIQRNAIRSWAQLRPRCEIFLLGNDDGTAEMAAEIGAAHFSALECNDFGTPLLRSAFSIAEHHARHPLLCFMNADIILLDDFLPSVERVFARYARCLCVGQRWDLDITEELAFDATWREKLRARMPKGHYEPPTGMDYFVFPYGLFTNIPAFAIGRPMYDQWLLSQARSARLPLLDATKSITAIHQNHGRPFNVPGRTAFSWMLEAERNVDLAGGMRSAYTLRDATHQLLPSRIRRRPLPVDLKRVLVFPFTTHPRVRPWVQRIKALKTGRALQRVSANPK